MKTPSRCKVTLLLRHPKQSCAQMQLVDRALVQVCKRYPRWGWPAKPGSFLCPFDTSSSLEHFLTFWPIKISQVHLTVCVCVFVPAVVSAFLHGVPLRLVKNGV